MPGESSAAASRSASIAFPWRPFLGLAGGITVVMVIAVWLTDPEKRDLVAASSAWFSGLAFGGLVLQLALQAQEIAEQGEVIERQHRSLERQGDALALAAYLQTRQLAVDEQLLHEQRKANRASGNALLRDPDGSAAALNQHVADVLAEQVRTILLSHPAPTPAAEGSTHG